MPDLLNPYAPPAAEAEAGAPKKPRKPKKRDLASLGKRFLGNLIDRLLVLGAGYALAYEVVHLTGSTHARLLLVAGELPALMVEWVLVAWRGQSIGKILTGTRIVRMNGAAPGWLHGVILRAWPIMGIAWAQLVPAPFDTLTKGLNLALFADAVFIFTGQGARRCLHDLLADTCVVDVLRDRS